MGLDHCNVRCTCGSKCCSLYVLSVLKDLVSSLLKSVFQNTAVKFFYFYFYNSTFGAD